MARPNFAKCSVHVAYGRGSSDGVAIRYVFPVLWMTSCFHTMRRYVYKKNRQVARQITTAFGWVYQNAALGRSRYLRLPRCCVGLELCVCRCHADAATGQRQRSVLL